MTYAETVRADSRPLQAKRLTTTITPSVTVFDPKGYRPDGTLSPTIITTYDKNGNKVTVTDANGTVTQMTYDARNRAVRTIIDITGLGTFDPAFNGTDLVTTTLYTLVDKPRVAKDSRGNATTTAYDLAYRITSVSQPQVADAESGGTLKVPVMQTAYDLNSNVVRMTDPRGIVTTTTYDELNRVRTVTQAAGTADQVVTESQYDAGNNVIALILKNGGQNGGDQTTSYLFDAYNRKVSETLPSPDGQARVTTLTYNPNGTLQSRKDPLGQVAEMLYDRASRLTSSVHKRANGTIEETRTYVYTKTGKPQDVTDIAGASHMDYDNQDRLLAERRTPVATAGQAAYTVYYAYDAVGSRTRVIYPGTSRTLVSAYDRASRLVEVRDGAKTTFFTYDQNGNRLTETTPNGVLTTSQFDVLNRAIWSVSSKAGTVIARYDYTFDLVGNRRQMVETLSPQAPRTVSYIYDAQYRLTSETTSGFSQVLTYDPAGNRTKLTRVEGGTTTVTTYVCDPLNRLLSSSQAINGGAVAVTQYAYDLNGNQTSQTIPGRPVITMVWDTLNRLVGGNVLGLTAGIGQSYDYRTRRQTKANATTVTFYRYDQGDSFQELQSAAMQVEFVRGSGMGGGIGSILYSDRTMAGGSEETFTYNPSVGNVVALTNGIGATTETNRFDAFGNIIAATGTSLNNRLANTKERDVSISGVFTLDNHGFRYYNPITGRYISRDPLGYKDGANCYIYVGNNPINRIDPLGLWSWSGFGSGLISVVTEPFKMAADVVTVAGAKVMGIASEDVHLSSALGQRQQARINEGQSALEAATKGTTEVVAATVTLGVSAMAQAHVELYQAYSKGEISLEQYDYAMSKVAGGASAAAALGSALSIKNGTGWNGRGGTVAAEEGTPQGKPSQGTAKDPEAPPAPKADTAEQLQQAADQASATVGPGKGPQHGTKVHSEFEKLVDALGRDDLHTEVSYKDGKIVPRGTPGSVRPDVVEGPIEAPHAVHDLKTGGATVTKA
jgi:RHS repeat-associated protein